MNLDAEEARMRMQIASLRRDYRQSMVLLLWAILCNYLAIASILLLRLPGFILFLALELLAISLMYFGMTASCRAKGHSTRWALVGLIVAIVCSGLPGVLIVAALPDKMKRLRKTQI